MTSADVEYIINLANIHAKGSISRKGVLELKDYAAGKPWKLDKQQHIMKTAYELFSKSGIIPVTMADIAKASGVGRVTVFRYFTSKAELVIAVSTWKWREYIQAHQAALPPERLEKLTGAEYLRFYLDSFLDLYRSHPDLLRFNYDFNSFLRFEAGAAEQKQPYLQMVNALGARFHRLYARGLRDGTLRADISESTMFSASFHIMLAAATRYAVGLVVMYEDGYDPESELVLLEELLLSRFTKT